MKDVATYSEAVPAADQRPSFLEFFAGSGLVALGMAGSFRAAWANDISQKKAVVYDANHDEGHFHLGSISDVSGKTLPAAPLAWASFPCQDLSLAGLNGGINASRSGLVWEWLRVIDEMPEPPAVLVAENVVGLLSANGGAHYRTLHTALTARGYKVGAIILDAVRWLPQSRPRVFVVAHNGPDSAVEHLTSAKPDWMQPEAVRRAAAGLEDWVWWSAPEPTSRASTLADIVEWDAEHDSDRSCVRNLALIPERHRAVLDAKDRCVAPGYKRTRNGKQVLEIRFDGVAGCLRTPRGGSSRQFLVLRRDGKNVTRLLTIRETARLMGAPETFLLPGRYNDGYMAMGDAVAVPVAEFLAKNILRPLVDALTNDRADRCT